MGIGVWGISPTALLCPPGGRRVTGMTPQQASDRPYALAMMQVLLGQYGLWETLRIFEEALASSSHAGEDHPIVYHLRWLRNKHEWRSKR